MEKEIVLYRVFDSAVEATLVKDVLETNGVPCFLSNEIFSSVLPLTQTTVGGIRLNLFADDLERADAVMRNLSFTDEKGR